MHRSDLAIADRDLISARSEKLRQALGSDGPTVAVAATHGNVTYASGYRSVAGELYENHRLTVFAGDRRVVLVAPANDVMAFMREQMLNEEADAPLCDLVPYGAFYVDGDRWRDHDVPKPYPSMEEAMREAARQVGLRGAQVVADDVAAPLVREVVASKGGVLAADGEDWWQRLRQQKLPEEIAMLERAADAAEKGIAAGIAGLREGVSEAAIASLVSAEIAREGGMPKLLSVSFGEASASGDVHPSNAIRLGTGETVRFDIGCVVGGYWADTARCAVLGEPTAEQASVYAALLLGQEVELELARPGRRVASVASAAIEAVREAGISSYRRHHVGHGIGLQVYESPLVTTHEERPFLADMVLCLETPYYRVGWGGLMIEDTVVLEDGGYRSLTKLGKDLAVVPL